MNVAYNRDCMEAMKEYPDGYFDLAVVDPPYGDAGGQSITCTAASAPCTGRKRQAARRDLGSCKMATSSGGGWNRFGHRFDRYKLADPQRGWHGKDKHHLGQSQEPAEPGLKNTPKKS